MNFLDIKAGETIEVRTQKAYRIWRYVFPPYNAPVRLLSWVSDMRWRPLQFVEGTTPDEGEQGIHGFKTMDDLVRSFRGDPECLVTRSQISGCDGVVFELSSCGASFGITLEGTERSSHGPCLLFPVTAFGARKHWPSCVEPFSRKAAL